MSETCKHPDSSFDRTLCAEPCGAMHNYCTECGECVDPCPHKATPSSGVTEGKAESDGYPFMTVQDAIETAILARGVDVPDLADVVFVAAEAVQALWPPAPSDEGQARVLRDLVAWRAGFHAIDTARGSGRFTAVREALTELELIVDRADAALVTPATEGEALSGAVSAHVSKLLDVWRRQRSIVRPDEKIPTPLAVALDCLMNAVWLEKRTAQPPTPADDTATVLAGLRVEMVALADDAFGFEGAGLFRDAVRQSVALVEAAQQRLADRGRGGGEG